MAGTEFRNSFAEQIFVTKRYQNRPGQTWAEKAKLIVETVCSGFMDQESKDQLAHERNGAKYSSGQLPV